MSTDAKQREWIWEFFLKNCKDARMIHGLMTALPFPNENLDLQRLFLLRSLSLQIAAGIIDEFTLDILRGLGDLSRLSEAARKDTPSANFSSQEVAKRRKGTESNDDEAATNSATPHVKEGLVPSWTSEQQRRGSGNDSRKAEPVFGIRDWMKGRALPRTVGGDQTVENVTTGSNLNMDGTCPPNAGPSHVPEDRDRSGSEFVFNPGQSATQWELELAVMLELAVKHLRGDSPDRKSFEHAVTEYWGESPDDTEALAVGGDSQETVRVRDQIKSELWMVRRNPELLDDVVEKYTKPKVEVMMTAYLEKAWAAIGQTFLERVSADVVNGKYKPVNCNGQRPKKGGCPQEDGDVGQQSSGKVDTSEKPWIRASRGRYSKTREKLQKNFAIWDLDDAHERDKDGAKATAEQQAGGAPNRLDQGHEHDDTLNQGNKPLVGGEVRPSLATYGGVGVRCPGFEGSVARVLEFDDPDGSESKDGKQSDQEKQDTVRRNIEVIEAEHPLDQRTGPETVSVGGDVDVTLPDGAKGPGPSNVINLSARKERETTADENRTNEASSPARTDEPHEVLNKENVVPPLSPRPTAPNPTVYGSPASWVEGSPAVNFTEGIAPGVTRKRKSGQEATGVVTRREAESRSGKAAATTTGSSQSPDTVSTQRNLRRKQRVLDAVVKDPLPKILTSQPRGSLLERNATARTVEWEEEDDIEESPSNSPSASRHVRLPNPSTERRITPLVGSKTSRNMNAKQTRRKPRRWSEKEAESLKIEVGKYGKGRWKLILEKNLDTFQGRTEVDLKDKWRNLERFEGIAG